MTMTGITVSSALRPNPVGASELVMPGDGRHGRIVMYAYDGGQLNLKDEHAGYIDQLN